MVEIIDGGLAYGDVLIVPKYNEIASRRDVSMRTKVTKNHYLEIPILAANMDSICDSKMAIAMGKLGGLGVIHRFLTIDEQVGEVKKVKKENLLCAAAVGIKDYEERASNLISAGVNILVLDVAHGHSKKVGEVLEWIKVNFPSIDIMVGNIATSEAARYFISKGADALKIGIGPGSLCTTRIMTGVGVPQLTAIINIFEETQGKIPLCADGGIKFPGDITKAIGAGADSVMIGGLLSGADETPGKVIEEGTKKFKVYRGMASSKATAKKLDLDGLTEKEIISIEGEETFVEIKGSTKEIITRLLGGLASGMTYVGAGTIEEIKGKVNFIKISSEGYRESIAHGLE